MGGLGTGEVSRENHFLADQLGTETPLGESLHPIYLPLLLPCNRPPSQNFNLYIMN